MDLYRAYFIRKKTLIKIHDKFLRKGSENLKPNKKKLKQKLKQQKRAQYSKTDRILAHLNQIHNCNYYSGIPQSAPPEALEFKRICNLIDALGENHQEGRRTRVHLMDLAMSGKVGHFMGIITDIKIHDDHNADILLFNPQELNRQSKLLTDPHTIGQHIWISTGRIVGGYHKKYRLALGELIEFQAQVNQYRGKNHQYRYGFDNIILVENGIGVTQNHQYYELYENPHKDDIILETNDHFMTLDELQQASQDKINQQKQRIRFNAYANPYHAAIHYLNKDAPAVIKDDKVLKQALHDKALKTWIGYGGEYLPKLAFDFKTERKK